MSSRMGTFGGSHVLQPQNLDFGRPVHKCLCNCNFVNNKGFVMIFRMRTQEIQVLSLPLLSVGSSCSDNDTFRISDPKTRIFYIMKLEISVQVGCAGVVTHSEEPFRLL